MLLCQYQLDAPSIPYVFKLSKRQWSILTVSEGLPLLEHLSNIHSTQIGSNSFLLFGFHDATLQNMCLSLQIYQETILIHDQNEIIPKQVIPIEYTVETLEDHCFFLGGGCTFFWNRHFNPFYMATLPPSLHISYLPSCSLIKSHNASRKRLCCSSQSTLPEQSILTVLDMTKLKQVKLFLETAHLYDKSRKITRIHDQMYAVPVTDRVRLENSLQNMPESLIQVISLDNSDQISMECTSYSVKANLKRQLEKWYRSCHYVSCVSFIVNLSPLQLHRIEVLGNIVILNQGSFKGESWSSLWPVLAASPSVISHQSPLTEREQSFLTILCDCYGCERVGIHEEIDCGIGS